MGARGTVVTGLCPACGHENEDLTHLWWNCKAEQYAHIREKAPQPTNVEAMHPAFRDMILAQKDTQLLDWERNNRTNEITAVAAAMMLRSRIEDARDEDDGSKMSAAKAAEELGGYLCEGRLQVRTDGSCLDLAMGSDCESGSRSQAKHTLLNQSTNRPDVSQRRTGGGDVCHPGIRYADAHTHALRVGRTVNKTNPQRDREGRNAKQKRTP